MDKLDVIFNMQKALDDDIAARRNLPELSNEVWIQKEVLAMVSELGELLNEVNFKWWKNDKPMNSDAVKEEMIDILHFFVGMCIKAGMDADELYAVYVKKNKENYDRQYGRSSKQGYMSL
mgnify:CR=1 FL=1